MCRNIKHLYYLVTPDYVWGAAILMSVGGNTVRMASLQFANLFPSARNTAMAIISGIFTPSAGVLMLLQVRLGGVIKGVWRIRHKVVKVHES